MQKRVLIVISKDKQSALPLVDKISHFLQRMGIESDLYCYDGFSYGIEMKNNYTHAISLGGDGTVLFTARLCAPYSIPVFPINFGRFGFIASIEPNDWEKELNFFIEDKCLLYERLILCASIIRKNVLISTFEALNDIVASASSVGKLVSVDVSFDDVSFGIYRGDGIIISTPTGSTAYSAAVGGPILDATLSAFVLTPMAPFSLSNRPIVLPSSGSIKMKALETQRLSISLIADGHKIITLKRGDVAVITESKHKAILAGCSPDNFYSALKTKLGWQGSALK